MTVRILLGDMREKLAEVADCSIDSIVTDPPYHLTTGKKGGSGSASEHGKASPFGAVSRLNSAGFMGMKWDGGDVAMQSETWAMLLRVAKPGAHLVAFGGARTFHRLWCAVEDAGWEIRDSIMWLHGEGFPKSSNQRDAWDGWGTALKPAFEPIVLARKTLIGTVPENLKRYGVGALNINECRVPVGDADEYERNFSGDRGHAGTRENGEATSMRMGGGTKRKPRDASSVFASTNGTGMANENNTNAEADPNGRWPANVMHDGSDEVVGMFPAKAGAFAPVHRRNADKFRGTFGAFKGDVDEQGSTFHDGGELGSAARFFWCPKASRRDRNDGLSGMPQKTVNWSSGEQSPGTFQSENTERALENHHPTVKPTELMQYLCRLVTPRGGVILDPFMGSGSTGKAAVLEGMQFVGIELDPGYIEIATQRIKGVAPLFVEVAA